MQRQSSYGAASSRAELSSPRPSTSHDCSPAVASASMQRKRTLDTSSSIYTAEQMGKAMLAASSPQAALPSFEIDAVSDRALAARAGSSSSPYAGTASTKPSSPMSIANSPHPSVSTVESPDNEDDSGDEEWKPDSRPGMKRRKTTPLPMSTPSRREPRSASLTRPVGKDGEDIWSDDVEAAFNTGEECTHPLAGPNADLTL